MNFTVNFKEPYPINGLTWHKTYTIHTHDVCIHFLCKDRETEKVSLCFNDDNDYSKIEIEHLCTIHDSCFMLYGFMLYAKSTMNFSIVLSLKSKRKICCNL